MGYTIADISAMLSMITMILVVVWSIHLQPEFDGLFYLKRKDG